MIFFLFKQANEKKSFFLNCFSMQIIKNVILSYQITLVIIRQTDVQRDRQSVTQKT